MALIFMALVLGSRGSSVRRFLPAWARQRKGYAGLTRRPGPRYGANGGARRKAPEADGKDQQVTREFAVPLHVIPAFAGATLAFSCRGGPTP
jgi:hypothetical protein